MMKAPPKIFAGLMTSILLLSLIGCSSRLDVPEINSEGTIIFPPKNSDDINVNITLCRRIDKKTGERIGEGSVFTVMEKEWLRTIIDIENRLFYNNKELVFNLDWIGEDEKSFYLKQLILLPEDTSNAINSSVSLDPESRQPGKYKLKIYLFRELIAMKEFEILPKFQPTRTLYEELSKNLVLYSKIDKKSGKRIGIDSTFHLKEKGKVRAFLDLGDKLQFGDRELRFRLDWIGTDDSLMYRKRIDIPRDDPTTALSSSISISPDKRPTGTYGLNIYLFNELIAQKNFQLLPEEKKAPKKEIKLKAQIAFCSKINKETGERIEEGSVFTIKEKAKVIAFVELKNRDVYGKKELKFRLEWVGPTGKSFYRKKIDLLPDNTSNLLKSSISLSPDKRQAGEYALKVYLNNSLVTKQSFTLVSE